MRIAHKMICSLASIWFTGCTIVPGLQVNPGSTPEDGSYRVVALTPKVLNELAAVQVGAAPASNLPSRQPLQEPGEYRIGPGDVLSVTVWDHPELTNPAGEYRDAEASGRLVDSDGTIFFPFVGVFKVAGQTAREVRDYLARNLTRVIQSPQIDVRVISFRSKRIQITGEVAQPGTVALDDTDKGVLEALNERGGLSANASRRNVLLVRDGVTHRIDLVGLLSGSRPGSNPLIKAGDVIHVPDSAADRVFVLGEVRSSAPVTMMQNGLTLTEALTTVGGLERLSSDDSGVLIFRRAPETADNMPTIFTLNMGRPEGMLLAGEFELSPRDVVYVKSTDFSKYNSIINQLLPTISAIFQVDRLTDR